MQKHHWYVVIGSALAVSAKLIATVVPAFGAVHGAGIGIAIAGCIDWYFALRS